jgi:ribonuclease P protein component
MLNARYRFHGYGSLKTVYRNGQTVRGSLMNLKYAPRHPGKPYRAAVVVSKKVHKSAVTRNRIRRRIYEIIRQADERLTAGKDLVLTVFSERTADIDSAKLKTAVEDLLQKAGKNPESSNTTSVDHGIVRRERDS